MPIPSPYRRTEPLLTVGRAIRELRKERGLTLEQLGLAAEVDGGYIGRVERGDNNVAFTTLHKIATALDVPVSDLLRRVGL